MKKKKKKTAVWFYPEIDDVDAKQYFNSQFRAKYLAS